jgi:DNA-binding NarL/FixJ family response regulator
MHICIVSFFFGGGVIMSKNDEKSKKNKQKILTQYDQFVVPRLRDIPVWIHEGATDEEIAGRLNIHIRTLGDYRRKHPTLEPNRVTTTS